MKLLLDMNLARRWVPWLQREGRSAVHWSDVGDGGASLSEIMTCAKANDFVVLAHDLEFGSILAATQGEKPSVSQFRADDTSPEAIGSQLMAAIG